ncbi:MAG: pentapeptide repeat-containing protein [Anaerolineae bacterium]|nr:pentapeptide repeat-containing protein [Anaerolineae bacterium]
MDGVRKGEIISFLYGTELIFRNAPVISLAGAELTQIYLAGVNMAWVNLAEACLMRGNLAWVNLAWANLEDANLFGADLFLTDLGRACLVGANLQAANLFGADLAQAEYDASTQWPIGFDPVAAGAIEVTRA